MLCSGCEFFERLSITCVGDTVIYSVVEHMGFSGKLYSIRIILLVLSIIPVCHLTKATVQTVTLEKMFKVKNLKLSTDYEHRSLLLILGMAASTQK